MDTTDAEGIGLSFGRERRLHATTEFSSVFATRRVLRGKIFDLHYRARDMLVPESALGARLGLVIAKKLARRAVLRNLVKRLAREVFRQAEQRSLPYDLVLRLAKAPSALLNDEARKLLRIDLEQLLTRLPQCKSC